MSVSEQDKSTLNTEVVTAIAEELKKVDFVDYFLETIEGCGGNLVDAEDNFTDGYVIDEMIESNFSFGEIVSDIFIGWLNKAEIQITISL